MHVANDWSALIVVKAFRFDDTHADEQLRKW